MKLPIFILATAFSLSLSGQVSNTFNILNEIDKADFLNPSVYNSTFRGNSELNSLEEALDETFDSLVAGSTLKGFTAAIDLPDGSIWKRAAGDPSSAPNDSLTTELLMGIGSTTKTFTATLLLLLQDDGLLSVDDSLYEYLPSYPYIDSAITIRQLLNHTSGIYNYTDHPDFSDAVFTNPSHIWSPEEMLAFVLPPNFAPGAGWSYSNTNYILAGMIIEAVTGHSYQTELRERILTPLGLNSTFYYPLETPNSPIAHVWFDIDGNDVPDDVQSYITLTGYFSAAGSAGAIVSKPEDIAVFMKKLVGQEILSPQSFNDMFFLVPLEPSGFFGYGLGMYNVYQCSKVGWGHDGYIFYQTAAYHFPDFDASFAVIANDGDTNPDLFNANDLLNGLVNTFCNYTPVAVAEVPTTDIIQISPNPVQDQLNVKLSAGHSCQYKITDVNGKIAKKGSLNSGDSVLDTRALRSGTYFLKLYSTSLTQVLKFIKL